MGSKNRNAGSRWETRVLLCILTMCLCALLVGRSGLPAAAPSTGVVAGALESLTPESGASYSASPSSKLAAAATSDADAARSSMAAPPEEPAASIVTEQPSRGGAAGKSSEEVGPERVVPVDSSEEGSNDVVELVGLGECKLTLGECLSLRHSSIAWSAQGRCSNFPDRRLSFILKGRFDRGGERQRGFAVKDWQQDEAYVADALRRAKTKVRSADVIGDWEVVGTSLGTMELRLNQKGLLDGQCIFKEGTNVQQRWGLDQDVLLKQAGTMKLMVDLMAGFPLMQIAEKLSEFHVHKAIAPCFLAVSQAFRWYDAQGIAHCDRSENHILFNRAVTWKNMPIATSIDHDRMLNYKQYLADMAKNSQAAAKVEAYRRHMVYWFAVTVNNVCMLGQRKTDQWLALLEPSCPPEGPPGSRIQEQLRVLGLLDDNGLMPDLSDQCRGASMLRQTVIGPALRYAAGIGTFEAEYWREALEAWAAEFYGGGYVADHELPDDALSGHHTPLAKVMKMKKRSAH
eukprot:TRINITY_DN40012_c0_g1_i1.p1 TRINITY_DN40012_c0_g1~~TRINITY_DN40012_c0_g1_i1.p1  ORF type:complete len:515 (+),score=88.72 TRINITY_DN40012_c0_g1_i1:286-1830(+)